MSFEVEKFRIEDVMRMLRRFYEEVQPRDLSAAKSVCELTRSMHVEWDVKVKLNKSIN